MKTSRFIKVSRSTLTSGASIATIAASLYAAVPAQAQVGNEEEADENNFSLDEIVVTAQRRAQNTQDVPIAINAFSNQKVERLRIQDFTSLSVNVPGFSVNSFSKSRLNPSLRGGSSSLASAGAEQAVGLFIDDQYFGGAGDFEIDLFDVERIEVLRGPQGTLFGRNTTGGSINVVTRRPSEEFEAKVSATVGNYNALEFRGLVTGPLSDNLSALVAFSSRDRSGTSLNLTTGNRVDDTDRSSFRGKLLWEPTDTLEVLATLGFSRAGETGVARDAIFNDVPITNQDLIDIGFVPDDDPREVQSFNDGRFDSEQWTGNLRIAKDLGNAELLSITSYRNYVSDEDENSLAGVPIQAFSIADPRDIESFSQELRYTSDFEGPLNFVGGAFFFYSDERRNLAATTTWEENTFGGAFQAITFCPDQTGDDFDNGVVNPACIANLPELFTPNSFFVNERNRTTSFSAFLDGNYDVTEEVTFIAGLRYTYDRKRFNAVTGGDPDFFWNPPVSDTIDPSTGVAEVGQTIAARDNWDEITYRVGIQYQPTSDLQFYAMRSTGFRSGVFDAAQSDPVLAGAAVAPETVLSHEVGAKTRFFDERVQLNLALFHARYDDLQFFVNTGAASLTTNAGRARVRGVEVDLTAALTEELTVSAQYAHQDGTSSGIPPEAEIADGTPPQGTIPHTYMFALDYSKELSNDARVYAHFDFQRRSRFNLELEDAPQFFSETDALINMNVGYVTPDGWDLKLWVQNLTNENIVLYGQNFWFTFYDGPTAFSNLSVIDDSSQPRYQAPRTYGVTITKSF